MCEFAKQGRRPRTKHLWNRRDQIFKSFKNLFSRVRKTPTDRLATPFNSQIKPVQAKDRRFSLNLIIVVSEELKRMATKITLKNATKIVLSAPIVITKKKHGSIRVKLDSKMLNDRLK